LRVGNPGRVLRNEYNPKLRAEPSVDPELAEVNRARDKARIGARNRDDPPRDRHRLAVTCDGVPRSVSP